MADTITSKQEWKDFHRAIRLDARTFQQRHGGYPHFRRYFLHNGIEYTMSRFEWSRRPSTEWRASCIIDRPRASLIALELEDAAQTRRCVDRAPWKAQLLKRSCRMAVAAARALRVRGATAA